MNLQLENYKNEFEKVQKINQRTSHESSQENYQAVKAELEELRIKLREAQEERFTEKEKCIELDLKIGNMNIEIQNLKMDK